MAFRGVCRTVFVALALWLKSQVSRCESTKRQSISALAVARTDRSGRVPRSPHAIDSGICVGRGAWPWGSPTPCARSMARSGRASVPRLSTRLTLYRFSSFFIHTYTSSCTLSLGQSPSVHTHTYAATRSTCISISCSIPMSHEPCAFRAQQYGFIARRVAGGRACRRRASVGL